MDCNGHGTHVAALAAGKTYGVLKELQCIACVFLAVMVEELLLAYFLE